MQQKQVKLSADQTTSLGQLEFSCQIEPQFDKMLNLLKQYKEEHGNSCPVGLMKFGGENLGC